MQLNTNILPQSNEGSFYFGINSGEKIFQCFGIVKIKTQKQSLCEFSTRSINHFSYSPASYSLNTGARYIG